MHGAIRCVLSAAIACGLAAAAACGSSSPTEPSAPGLTQAQLTSLENAFYNVENALAPQIIPQVLSDQSGSATVPLNISTTCSTSGTAGAAGTVTGVETSPGKGMLNANLTITFSQCVGGGVELDGTLPSAGQMIVDDSTANIVVNPVTFTISGSSTFVLNGVTGTTAFNCSNSLTVDVNAGTTSGITSTGNATLHYPTGQNSSTVPCSEFSKGFNARIIPALAQRAFRLRPSGIATTSRVK